MTPGIFVNVLVGNLIFVLFAEAASSVKETHVEGDFCRERETEKARINNWMTVLRAGGVVKST